jgi:hypothetical protein
MNFSRAGQFRLVSLLFAVAVFVLASTLTTEMSDGAAAYAATRTCSNTYGGDVIETRNVRCRKAHRIVRTWARRYKGDGKVNRRVLRFRCRGRNDRAEGLVVRCKRGHASVTFYANVP